MVGRRSNAKNIVIGILIVLLLALAGLSSYLLFFKENDNKTNDCKDVVIDDKKEEVSVKNKIEIYGKKMDNGAYLVCNHQDESDDCKNTLFTIETETANANIIHMNLSPDNFQFIIYYDNGVKLYDIKEEKSSKLDINLNGNIEWLVEGYINNGTEEAFYYSIKDNKKVYEKYDEMYPVEDIHDSTYLDNLKYIYAKKGTNSLVIDFKTGNVLITIDNSNYEGVGFKKDGSYIIASLYGTEDTQIVIYNTKGEKITDILDNQTFEINGSKLIIYEYSEKKIKEY